MASALALLVLTACSRAPTPGPRHRARARRRHPDAVALLAGEGKLPHFAALHEGLRPPAQRQAAAQSILWTTVATGRRPTSTRSVTSSPSTRPPASSCGHQPDAQGAGAVEHRLNGRSVAIVGWWATWPAEAVNGAIVSDHLLPLPVRRGPARRRRERAASRLPAGAGRPHWRW
ncbi:MAG: hypothetical protein U0802_01240 [Candidatus Binatia bacterium]